LAFGAGGSMIQKKTEQKIKDAYKLLTKYGIFCIVPGWYDLDTAEDAVLFAKDRDRFYEIRK
jgi:hypothetical protein